jgi:hypothetical protein
MPLSPAEIAAAHAANARWERYERRRKWLTAAGYVLAALALAWYIWAVHHPAPERLPADGARCADGWVSHASGQGACSHHGGVARWIVNGVEKLPSDSERSFGFLVARAAALPAAIP